ncbi:HAMP domain-containing histidine kinase [bacterium]|nr:HAMP domain-containing histidine kinase [bacterium]
MRLRRLMLIALLLAGLLPIIPLWWVVTSVVNQGANTLAPESLGEGLQHAIDLAKREYQDAEIHLKDQLEKLVAATPKVNTVPILKNDIINQQTQKLYFIDNNPNFTEPKCLLFSSGEWKVVPHPQSLHEESFREIPSVIQVSQAEGNYTWILEEKLDPEFVQKAELLRSTWADWQVRSMHRDDVLRSLLITYLIIYAIVIVVSLLAGMWVTVSATKRIEKLTAVASEVAKGNEETRASIVGTKEIRQLASTFNMMLDRLDESRRKAADMEKKAAWRGLARILAHEIKNPLTPIQLSVRQLSDSYQGDDENYREMVMTTREIVDEEVESLRKLIKEFGDFARAPKLSVNPESPVALAEDLQGLYSSQLTLDLADNLPEEISIDREKIRRALINLIDNGIAAASAEIGTKARAELRLYVVDELLYWEVEDNGPGVPEDKCDSIFEPYFTTKRTGVGLGLPIVRTIASQHGGDIECLRGEKLGGALFRIHLPVMGVEEVDDESER